jgi:transposase
MVGKRKQFKKTYPSFLVETYVPKTNFYRQIKQLLKLDFLYQAVAPYYGKCGQKSIDPVVFFKLQLVAHFENICSDRALIEKSGLRLDILYFLDYNLGERLPCHSTLSRTRKRLPAEVFETCFQAILTACVEAGMVSGHTQVVDAAFVEANASTDSLKRKALLEWQLLRGEAEGVVFTEPLRQESAFTALEKTTKPKSCPRNNRSHISISDPEAKLTQKAGKPSRLYYLSSMAVDTYRHVITHIQADLADERDSRHLMAIVDKLSINLKQYGLCLQYLLADGGFSSGENYSALEARHIKGFIPLHGSYHPVREGFHYDSIENAYVCRNEKLLYYHGIRMENGFATHYYHARVKDCKECPLKKECCGNKRRQSLTFSVYRRYHQLMQERVESREGKSMKRRRMATVEPVFGSLLNYYGMKRSNAKGKLAAHKIMLMAATAYNLQKLLTHIHDPKNKVQVLPTQQVLALYFTFLCVVQQPGAIHLTHITILTTMVLTCSKSAW